MGLTFSDVEKEHYQMTLEDRMSILGLFSNNTLIKVLKLRSHLVRISKLLNHKTCFQSNKKMYCI